MFDTVTREGAIGPRSCTASLAASFVAHAALVGSLLLVPLFMREDIPVVDVFLFTQPKEKIMHIVPPPPPVSSQTDFNEQSGAGSSVSYAEVPYEDMTEPTRIPGILPPPSDEIPVFRGGGVFSGGNGAGISAIGPVAGAFNILPIGSIPSAPAPPLEIKKPPLRIGILEPSKIIRRVPPEYPELAARMRVSGTVDLEAIIDEEGNIADVTVIKGHPLLRDAAVDAVKQWKYTPTIQNGEPIPIIATIKLTFKIQ